MLEVLDFNLYLSPFDVWTAAVFDPEGDDSGPAAVVSGDNSCTVPAFSSKPGLTTAGGDPYVEFLTISCSTNSLVWTTLRNGPAKVISK